MDTRATILCVGAALLAGLVYLNALHNPFIYDDYHTVVENTSIQNVWNLRAIALHDITRPLVNLSYAADRAIWGPKTLGYHVDSVLLHMLNVVLLFLLAWRLALDSGQAPLPVALTASGLFAVHPMMTEAVGYISGRSEVLCSVWFLSALLCGRRWIQSPASRERFAWAAATVFFWCLALATKETAAMFPFVLIALDGIVEPDGEAFRRRALRVYLPVAVIAVAAGLARLLILRGEYQGRVAIHWQYILVELDVLRRYVWLLVRPAGQTLFHAVPAIESVFAPRAIGAIVFAGIMVAAAWRLRRVASAASFGLFWFLLVMAPSAMLAVLNQGEPMAEHRVYMASAGFFLAAGIGVSHLDAWLQRSESRMPWAVNAMMAVVLLSFSAETLLRNAVWSDPVMVWQESAALAPTHYRPHLMLGEALEDRGRRADAIAQYRKAIELRPSELDAYVKLAVALAGATRFDEARETLRAALRVDPNNETARRALASVDRVSPAP